MKAIKNIEAEATAASSGREIERKYVVKAKELSQVEVDTILRNKLKSSILSDIEGESADYYYDVQNKERADFLRCRVFADGTAELTYKKKDKLTNLNRLERNLKCESSREAKEFCQTGHGDPIKKIQKRYTVLFCEDSVVVSTYVIEGIDKVYVEVEAGTVGDVDQTVAKIKTILELIPESRSLFEIYVEPALSLLRSDL